MEEEREEFRGDSGLKDDYDGNVIDAYFARGTRDQIMLFMKITADDGDEVENRYSVGQGWESYDGGKTIEHATAKRLNTRTALFDFMKCALESGGRDELYERSDKLERRGPRDSRLWVGTRWHFNVKTERMRLPQRNELGEILRDDAGQALEQEIDVNRVVPTKYLGVIDAANGAGATSTAAQPSTTNEILMTKVKVLAKTKSFGEWVDAVMDLPGAMEDDALMSRLGDEQFYASLRG